MATQYLPIGKLPADASGSGLLRVHEAEPFAVAEEGDDSVEGV